MVGWGGEMCIDGRGELPAAAKDDVPDKVERSFV